LYTLMFFLLPVAESIHSSLLTHLASTSNLSKSAGK
jgi:hypothetical protein